MVLGSGQSSAQRRVRPCDCGQAPETRRGTSGASGRGIRRCWGSQAYKEKAKALLFPRPRWHARGQGERLRPPLRPSAPTVHLRHVGVVGEDLDESGRPQSRITTGCVCRPSAAPLSARVGAPGDGGQFREDDSFFFLFPAREKEEEEKKARRKRGRNSAPQDDGRDYHDPHGGKGDNVRVGDNRGEGEDSVKRPWHRRYAYEMSYYRGHIIEIPGKNTATKAEDLKERLKTVFEPKGIMVAEPAKMAEFRLRELDESIVPEDVRKALAELGSCPRGSIRIEEIRMSPLGMGTIWAKCPVSTAKKAGDAKRIRVGWASATVELLKARPIQCFLAY
ncbi:hypothetical protein RF55_2771 [Lasius niger]|uniref:Uncharacterized protein n=1 Tax=Lasius niger TaxID=67767 RepID=A0A0J7NWX5_LASNI|nr:hypothetical protein RF55_2771 [Lasius niger]